MISFLAPLLFLYLALRKRATGQGQYRLLTLPVLTLVFLTLGFDLGPGTKPVPVHGGGDILFCLDVSRSMLARDLSPDRLHKAKETILNLTQQGRQDRFGLIAFAGSSRLLVPMTRDSTSFGEILETAGPLLVDRGGTDLGQALSLALDALVISRPPRSPCIVLLSDGEDFGNKGQNLAKRCKERGIPIFCIGLGTRLGSKIPIPIQNKKEVFLKDGNGKDVVTKLLSHDLEEIASLSGGAYFEDPNLKGLYQRAILRIREKQRGSPLIGQFFAFLGLLLLTFFIAKTPGSRP